MTSQEQQSISLVIEWAGSIDAAKAWYESEQIPALGSTAKVAVENGHHQAVLDYLDGIAVGGFS
jgi:hypothetical protein